MLIFIPLTFGDCFIVIVPEILIGDVVASGRLFPLALYTETVHVVLPSLSCFQCHIDICHW